MRRALPSLVITSLGIMAAVCSLSRATGSLGQGPNAVVTHRAMHIDVSRPLASIREPNITTVRADCEGTGCGTSPGVSADDSDAAQEQRQEEAIP
ncbi:MAG: hypothetical protein ACHP8A_18970, partial [Terriglobales bacterium]